VLGEIARLGIQPYTLAPRIPNSARSAIYVKIQMLAADEPAITIVGSSAATPYELEMTR
jgi:hypothetical protein